MGLYCEFSSLITESDIEQKFIYPLLSESQPIGMFFKDTEIYTKSVLRQVLIGKSEKKYYFPDYLIYIRGIPVLIVEAKAPIVEDLGKAYSEARLYATEINAQYPHGINSCQKIIVSNGKETWAGYYDQGEPELKLLFDDFNVENIKFSELLKFCNRDIFISLTNSFFAKIRGKAVFRKAVTMLGGKLVQNGELVENSYGRTLVFEHRNIFDPETEEERNEVVQNAYITSHKRDQHMDPIYSEIKKIHIFGYENSTLLSSDNPVELLDKISFGIHDHSNKYSLMLIIGNRGSGKTTFIRYFKNVFLNENYKDIEDTCFWAFINMNNAPKEKEEIYTWIRKNIIEEMKSIFNQYDFDDFEMIKKIFAPEILAFDKGIGSLLKSNEETYFNKLYELLNEKLKDMSYYMHSLINFFKRFFNKFPIVVLDNCDKRDKETQLLFFEVAQWLRVEYRCIVILPMRDTTYDMYKNEPPLDTVVKDLVFRIDAPDLLKVLQARLEYIARLENYESNSYTLENGVKIHIGKEEQIEYFKCILMTIRNNEWARNIFYRLSNKNTREGIQLFEDFCKSGHMRSEEILKIRTSGSEYEIPSYMLMNALLRKNRKYYNENVSNIINLFGSDYNDDFPDPFIRIDILKWLYIRDGVEGPIKIEGYFQTRELIKDMQVIGHDENITFRELGFLINKGLVLTESQSSEITFEDLIKITLSGMLHYALLKNVSYLAACAEDVYYKNVNTMTAISKRLVGDGYLSKESVILNAKDLIDYLIDYREEFISYPEICFSEKYVPKIYDVSECKMIIEQWLNTNYDVAKSVKLLEKYKNGDTIECKVVSKKSKGLVCIFQNEIKGFLSALEEKFFLSEKDYNEISVGDIITCEIIDFNYLNHSFQLKFIKLSTQVAL